MSLLVIGSVALDTLETPFGIAENVVGGSATFISTTASYFTDDISLVAVVGDNFPQEEIDFLKSKEIDISGLEVLKGEKTFHWHGKYHFDMNTRDTITTELNAFEHFDPVLSDKNKDCKYLCLGNIDPVLQKKVIEQVNKPELIMIDTMNFWIGGKKDELMETLKLVNIIVINDSEARELTEEYNLVTAAKKIMSYGPEIVVIKKGEHGALLFSDSTMFSAPAYPLEKVFDPTGAGDTFAGGFMGWIAKSGSLSDENLKLAMIYGSAMASLCVEEFSLEGIRNLSREKIMDRFGKFRNLTHFENIEI